jgi:hypothetical protein
MNLRIAPEQLRFRISADEFASLCAAGILEINTQLSATDCLSYAIRTERAPKSADDRTLELISTATTSGKRLELVVFADGIAQLQSTQVGKDGIQEHLAFANGELLTIGLEIDMHSKKGSA